MVTTNEFQTVWQTIISTVCIIITCTSYGRYRNKKSKIAYNLFIAFICYSLALISLTLISWNQIYKFIPSAPSPSFQYNLRRGFTSKAYTIVFLILGTYFIYQFNKLLIEPEDNRKKPLDYIAIVWLIFILFWGIFRFNYIDLTENLNLVLLLFLSIEVHALCLMIFLIYPVLRTSNALRKRIDEDDEHFLHVKYMFRVAILFILVQFTFSMDTTFKELFGVDTQAIFEIISWTCIIIAIWWAYLAFYK